MTVDRDALVEAAMTAAGSDDFGGDSFREGLDRLTDALAAEGELNDVGEQILGGRIQSLLTNRLRIEQTYAEHPEIAAQHPDAPIFILGLPRTGTTALSNLLSVDPQIRSLRVWESGDPVPPPEAATQDADPRIAATQAGLDMMDQVFPLMKSLYFQVATGPTECQDLLGMEFRTVHFDGMAHVPSYVDWVVDCDMAPAYRQHRRTLQLLQWRCPPNVWHLKTPVHMFALDALVGAYPDARFVWTHRQPVDVMPSLCTLIAYCRSWVSDVTHDLAVGPQQLDLWAEAVRRGLEFRDRTSHPIADVFFTDLEADPVGTMERAYADLGLAMSTEARQRIVAWSKEHTRESQSHRNDSIETFGLSDNDVADAFRFYTTRFGL